MFQRLEAAGGPDRRLAAFGAKRQLRADEEDLGLETQQRPRVVGHERSNLRHLPRAFENVALVDDDDDLLAPAANLLHEPALGLGERAIGGRHEEDEVGARDELRRHRLVLADDGVGPGRVDDADFAKELDRRLDDQQVGLADRLLGALAVLEHGDDGSRRRDAFLHQRLADERVDERALAGVELADDDQQEQLVELRDGLVERFLLVGAGVDPRQRGAQARSAAPVPRAAGRPVRRKVRASAHGGMQESDQSDHRTTDRISTMFQSFLKQHDAAAWQGAVAALLPHIHEVDRNATQIWFHFFPLELAEAIAESDNLERLR